MICHACKGTGLISYDEMDGVVTKTCGTCGGSRTAGRPIAEIVAELRQAAIEEGHDVCVNGPSLLRLLAELERLQHQNKIELEISENWSKRATAAEEKMELAERVREIQQTRKWTTVWVESHQCWIVQDCSKGAFNWHYLYREQPHETFTNQTDPWQPLLDAAAYFEERGK